MSESSNRGGGIVPALIVAAAFLGGSLIVANALGTASEEFGARLLALAGPPPPSARAEGREPPRGAKAGEAYDVDLGGAPIRGPEEAPITIVEFSDFQCPFCKRAGPTLAQIDEAYGDKVRRAFKHLPLSIHPQAPAAHAAAEAAHRQGRFWEMRDKIFENQRDLRPQTFRGYAEELGLDLERYDRDVVSEEVRARVDADMAQAMELGVNGTPAFFINGRFLSGAQPFANFKRVIDAELAKKS